ncbi:hypothetical protein BK654_26235 [Pseudomonas brassicacearum]|uniref:hypothetical protein n=1 Tax=Pseudomonas brassicacearum TaxID=930166 RepID=UPI000F48F18B|nr:hypothetical protein [Pseudomonas brassicacearum]ROM72656.1 hypothetical protein BK654_26235 [Pseudomonas brassicacearum]
MSTENAPIQVAKALRSAFSTRFALVCGLSLFIAGCAVPTGTAHLLKVQPVPPTTDVKKFEAAVKLKTDWDALKAAQADIVKKTGVTAAELDAADKQTQQAKKNFEGAIRDWKAERLRIDENIFSADKAGAIRKPDSNGSGGDVFAVYLTDAYFKYLKDLGGVNEVVIVAEFTEVGGEDKSETVTKVLGPYLGIADNSKPNLLNKLLYGPKKLESDHLSMKLTVLEYDQGENEDSAAFLDFIGSASKTLSLANPITAAEQVFAKEVAKSLLALNKDDVVLQIDVDMVAGPDDEAVEGNGSVLALKPGNYVLINQERCAPTNCYFYLTNRGNKENPLAWLGDTLMLVPTAMRRGWTDTPDGTSLEDIKAGEIEYVNHGLQQRGKDETFVDKTWLSLAVYKGGDDVLWGRRRALNEAEKAVQYIAKQDTSAILKNADYERARTALDAAQQAEQESRSGITFVSPLDAKGRFAPSIKDTSFCLTHAKPVSSPRYSFYKLKEGAAPTLIPNVAIVPDKSTSSMSCFSYPADTLATGKYQLVVTAPGEKIPVTQSAAFEMLP